MEHESATLSETFVLLASIAKLHATSLHYYIMHHRIAFCSNPFILQVSWAFWNCLIEISAKNIPVPLLSNFLQFCKTMFERLLFPKWFGMTTLLLHRLQLERMGKACCCWYVSKIDSFALIKKSKTKTISKVLLHITFNSLSSSKVNYLLFGCKICLK